MSHVLKCVLNFSKVQARPLSIKMMFEREREFDGRLELMEKNFFGHKWWDLWHYRRLLRKMSPIKILSAWLWRFNSFPFVSVIRDSSPNQLKGMKKTFDSCFFMTYHVPEVSSLLYQIIDDGVLLSDFWRSNIQRWVRISSKRVISMRVLMHQIIFLKIVTEACIAVKVQPTPGISSNSLSSIIIFNQNIDLNFVVIRDTQGKVKGEWWGISWIL